MSAPPGWRFGDPLTDEMKAKMAEGRRRSAEAKRKGKPPKQKAARAPRPETAPVRPGPGGLAEKTRGKIVKLVFRLLAPPDMAAAWVMRRMTKPVYKTNEEGVILTDDKGRPLIDGRVRSFTDEAIDRDRLEEWERYWLADELTNELIKYKKVRAFLLKAIEFEDRSSLPMCVMVIAVGRMMNHGMIPPGFAEMVKDARAAAAKSHPVPRQLREPDEEPAEPPIPESVPVHTAAA